MECFKVFKNNLENRYDPFFYKPEFIAIEKKLNCLKFQTKEIKDFSKVICGPFGSAIKVLNYESSGIPLIRISNIDENQELTQSKLVFINKDLAEKLSSYKVNKGDLIISQRGTLGVVAEIPDFFDGAIISANLIAIKKIKEILPNYLKIFLQLKIGQVQIKRKTSGQVQIKITTDDIKSLVVPIPGLPIQKEIIDLLESSYLLKKQKLRKANSIIESLNDHLYSQLGIDKIKYKIDLSTSGGIYTGKQIFTTFKFYYEDLDNKWDVRHYLPKYRQNIKLLKQSKYKIIEISKLAKEKIRRGKTPKYSESGIPVIKIASIVKDEVRFTGGYVNKFFFDSSRLCQIRQNDIIIASTGEGSIGKIAKYHFDKPAIADNHITIIRVDKNKVNPDFLVYFLVSDIGKMQLEHSITGSTGQTELYPNDIEKILVPIPSIEIQNKIAKEISNRKNKANKIKLETEEIIIKTKEKIENMILGI